MQTFLLAWRNIWRNPRRTLTAASAIGLSLTALLCTWSLVGGMWDHMLGAATDSFSGHALIHHREFRLTRDPEQLLTNGAGELIAASRSA